MTVTKQKVAATLRTAGYTASKISTTSVRGWTCSSAGTKTREVNGLITVEYVFGDYGRGVSDADRIRKLQAIQKALIDAGIQCYPNDTEEMLIIGDPDA
jgi:hypothetical protein